MFGVAHGLGRVEAGAVDKDCQPAKQQLIWCLEQVVAPLDGVSQGLVALVRIPRAACEHCEALAQPAEQG